MNQTSKRNVVVLGAGKIGNSITKLLHHSGDYQVTLADSDKERLESLKQSLPVFTRHIDVEDREALGELFGRFESGGIVVSALPFYLNVAVAQAALAAGLSYFDLTEDVATTKSIMKLSKKAKAGQVFMPQCGLAPGFISILGSDLAASFDELQSLKLMVGALPRYPSNKLKYNLTWSTDGLINEYCNPCEAVADGERIKVPAMEGYETFHVDGVEYEAFYTSGGLGTLCQTLAGKVGELSYKTIRYTGHHNLMNFLIKDLKLGASKQKRQSLKKILEFALPTTYQDTVLIFAVASGQIGGRLTQKSASRKINHFSFKEEDWSAIQITTAAGLCAVLDLFSDGKLGQTGFLKQESVPLADFESNRFGRYYKELTEDELDMGGGV